jgi:hypothetical protein
MFMGAQPRGAATFRCGLDWEPVESIERATLQLRL